MSEYHALLSPSGSAKWLTCRNSLLASKGQPETGSKAAANLGSDKHELLEKCLTLAPNVNTYVGQVMGYGNVVDANFIGDVSAVMRTVAEVVDEYEGQFFDVEMFVEQKVGIGHITGEEGATGTADVIIIATRGDYSELAVIDAKFGRHAVDAENNSQLEIYALGAINDFSDRNVQKVQMVIAQPANGGDTSRATVTRNDLLLQGQYIKAKAALVLSTYRSGTLELKNYSPNEKSCKWCPARALCPAVLGKVKDVMEHEFLIVENVQPAHLLSTEDLAKAFKTLDFIEAWAGSVRSRIEYELLNGTSIKGLKVVEGRKGNKAWRDQEAATQFFKHNGYPQSQYSKTSLLSPTAVEGACDIRKSDMKEFYELITRAPGKNVVCSTEDKRKEVSITQPSDDFDVVPN